MHLGIWAVSHGCLLDLPLDEAQEQAQIATAEALFVASQYLYTKK